MSHQRITITYFHTKPKRLCNYRLVLNLFTTAKAIVDRRVSIQYITLLACLLQNEGRQKRFQIKYNLDIGHCPPRVREESKSNDVTVCMCKVGRQHKQQKIVSRQMLSRSRKTRFNQTTKDRVAEWSLATLEDPGSNPIIAQQ